MVDKKKIKLILLLAVFSVALWAVSLLVEQRQELRRGAAANGIEAWFEPTESGSKSAGDRLPVYLLTDLSSKEMNAFTIKIFYSKDTLSLTEADVSLNSRFPGDLIIQKVVNQSEGAVYISAICSLTGSATGATGLLALADPWLKLNFTVVNPGTAFVKLASSPNDYGALSVVGLDESSQPIEFELLGGTGTAGQIRVDYNLAGGEVPTDVLTPTLAPVCTEGERDCNGPSDRRRLCANGQWTVLAPCSTGEVCWNGLCGEPPLPTPTSAVQVRCSELSGTCLSSQADRQQCLDYGGQILEEEWRCDGDNDFCCVDFTLPTGTPPPGAPIFNFKVSLLGVEDVSKVIENPRVSVSVKKSGSSIEFADVELIPDSGRLFNGSVVLVGVAPGDNYTIYIKGEKHLARKFCQDDQSQRCSGEGVISLVAGDNNFNFSGLMLEPGDLPDSNNSMQQDRVVNSLDLSLLKANFCDNFTKDCQYLNTAIADVDFNGVVNTRDIGLLLQTLSTKYGEED